MKKQSIVKSGQSQIQCSSNGKMSTAGLNLWQQNAEHIYFSD